MNDSICFLSERVKDNLLLFSYYCIFNGIFFNPKIN